MSKEQLTDLYNKYLENRCTPEELQTLVNTLGADALPHEEEVFALFDRTWNEIPAAPGKYPLPVNPPVISVRRSTWWRYAAAAAVIAVLATGAYVWLPKPKAVTVVQAQPAQEILPGGNKAMLTLANGQTIELDNAANGQLAQQGGTAVNKQDSSLSYQASDQTSGTVSYNVLTTPRGGFFSLTLPDGTKVWLNASSSLRFPTAFNGNERIVRLAGEAYFEVAKNASQPFRVIVNDMTVNVLGTSFNINAYTDEKAIRTTLLEGAVHVEQGNTGTRLQPGEQASLQRDGTFKLSNPDLQHVIAWKNGLFSFNGADLEEVMHQLSRWYDVNIKYTGPVKPRLFVGSIPRSYKLHEVLSILNASDVQFRIEGKQIIVTQ